MFDHVAWSAEGIAAPFMWLWDERARAAGCNVSNRRALHVTLRSACRLLGSYTRNRVSLVGYTLARSLACVSFGGRVPAVFKNFKRYFRIIISSVIPF